MVISGPTSGRFCAGVSYNHNTTFLRGLNIERPPVDFHVHLPELGNKHSIVPVGQLLLVEPLQNQEVLFRLGNSFSPFLWENPLTKKEVPFQTSPGHCGRASMTSSAHVQRVAGCTFSPSVLATAAVLLYTAFPGPTPGILADGYLFISDSAQPHSRRATLPNKRRPVRRFNFCENHPTQTLTQPA